MTLKLETKEQLSKVMGKPETTSDIIKNIDNGASHVGTIQFRSRWNDATTIPPVLQTLCGNGTNSLDADIIYLNYTNLTSNIDMKAYFNLHMGVGSTIWAQTQGNSARHIQWEIVKYTPFDDHCELSVKKIREGLSLTDGAVAAMIIGLRIPPSE